jgi:hypothetical protein
VLHILVTLINTISKLSECIAVCLTGLSKTLLNVDLLPLNPSDFPRLSVRAIKKVGWLVLRQNCQVQMVLLLPLLLLLLKSKNPLEYLLWI